ncbi:MAG: molybdopterin-binding protein [Corynebacterium sp.]|nr:molybdopterin-binding protein [Corynebacterium sp.]
METPVTDYSRSFEGPDFAEPDASDLLAVERESRAHQAMIVLVTDDPDSEAATADAELLAELLEEGEFDIDGCVAVEASQATIRTALQTAIVGGVDLVVTVGGVGVGPRDKTPEATRGLLDQELPGVSQAIRNSGLVAGALDAAVSRGITGLSGSTLIINLAGSREAIRDGVSTLKPLAHFVINGM